LLSLSFYYVSLCSSSEAFDPFICEEDERGDQSASKNGTMLSLGFTVGVVVIAQITASAKGWPLECTRHGEPDQTSGTDITATMVNCGA